MKPIRISYLKLGQVDANLICQIKNIGESQDWMEFAKEAKITWSTCFSTTSINKDECYVKITPKRCANDEAYVMLLHMLWLNDFHYNKFLDLWIYWKT
jgi:hypothetical protein